MHAQFPTDHISHAPTLHPNDRPGRQECAIKKKDYKNGDARTRTATRGVHCRLQSVCPCRCARARNRVAKNLQERAGVGSVRSVEVEKPSEGRSGKHAERGDELESAKPSAGADEQSCGTGCKRTGAPAHIRLVRGPVPDPGYGTGQVATRPGASSRDFLNCCPGPAPLGAARP